MDTSRPDYQSYLLRLWRGEAPNAWRASLQSTATEQVYHFATIEDLFVFLAAQPVAGTGDAPSTDTPLGL